MCTPAPNSPSTPLPPASRARESLHRFVHENASLTIGRNRRQFKELDKESLALESYDNGARQSAGMDERIDYRRSFRDAHKTFTEEQVKAETAQLPGLRRFGGGPQQVHRLRALHHQVRVRRHPSEPGASRMQQDGAFGG